MIKINDIKHKLRDKNNKQVLSTYILVSRDKVPQANTSYTANEQAREVWDEVYGDIRKELIDLAESLHNTHRKTVRQTMLALSEKLAYDPEYIKIKGVVLC